MPFKSMSSTSTRDAIGLTPCRSFEPTVKKRGPSAALRRHVRWLKELQDQMQAERQNAEEDEKQADERKQKMKVSFEKHREAVREMIQAREMEQQQTLDGASKPKAPEVAPKERSVPKKAAKSVKPLWAMTEEEKDKFEEDEGDDLIDFAENLDYEQLLGDLEFRQGLAALKDRHGKLRKEQDSFKDALVRDFNEKAAAEDEERSTSVGSPRGLEDGIEGASALGDLKSEYSVGSSRRSRGAGRAGAEHGGPPEWDASTNCGEDRPEINPKVKDAVDMVMESAPQLKQIHSKESVQKIIEASKAKQADLITLMNTQEAVPAPVIVASEDTQLRLHKPVDASLLPYLYRSPAV
jgi:hypothetical protein